MDLTHPVKWLPVTGADNILGTGSMMEVLDVGGTQAGQQFYRLVLLP